MENRRDRLKRRSERSDGENNEVAIVLVCSSESAAGDQIRVQSSERNRGDSCEIFNRKCCH